MRVLAAVLLTALIVSACGLRIEIRTDECAATHPKEQP